MSLLRQPRILKAIMPGGKYAGIIMHINNLLARKMFIEIPFSYCVHVHAVIKDNPGCDTAGRLLSKLLRER